ncbi:MAG: radical SAM protein [Candidatus Omnitrophica bacterium]|nr:radical SAM protein [Candidatus Omnitrophota bacterium]
MNDNTKRYPSYLEAYENGNLAKIIDKTFKMLEACCICPRKCSVNRLKDERGFCKTGLKPKVCSYMPHHGEEPPISGSQGSGTIFFSWCNMACVYCQNFEFSQLGEGREVELEELVEFMLQLQDMGCHNINFVTPTHVLPQILKSLYIAIPQGLKIPVVYNTSGYELPQIIELLEGIVDIYLPDLRYAEEEMAIKYSSAPGYPYLSQQSVIRMHKQVGPAQIDEKGIIKRGLIIRHLVLPHNISGTDKIMRFIAEEVSADTYISLMSQYFPCYKSGQFKEIARRITYEEYEAAKESMHNYGLHNGWIQESYGLERFAGINIKPRFKE